jgi:hypothetical protein
MIVTCQLACLKRTGAIDGSDEVDTPSEPDSRHFALDVS